MSNSNEKENELKRLEILLEKNMSRIKSKILVLSNKGGVGKSAVAVNIAVCLSMKGKKVGLLDADIHGPSVAKMLGFEGKKLSFDSSGLSPYKVNNNLFAVSIASLLETPDSPVIWRGPLKMGVLKQFLAEVNWGQLDFLVVDLPPGTGDEPLSICQMIKDIKGAIVVTTPQDVALLDSRKCVSFLKQLSIPILGILENMSGFTCPHCNKEIELFKIGGGEKASAELGVPFLGKIPFELNIVSSSDEGTPFIEKYPQSKSAAAIKNICDKL
ncbi:MAG: Mrp/NBP35 family ATP-binding protein [Elusimicrobia bacterium]|nr:Mrp/NBP35 family ATP-binding protein [Elusimicrobiota bacterium]